MIFTKRLRDGIRSGKITSSVRIWMRPHVKGFQGVVDLLKVAKHGRGENVHLVRFRYVPASR